MDVIARTSGPSAKRDIARSSRVSVGSFQRSLCETLYTSEETLRSVRVGWVGGNSFQGISEVSGMEWCTSQRTSETFRVLCGIIGGVKN